MAVAAPVIVRITLRGLLIPLAQLLACLVAIGLVYCADGIVRALFGVAKSAIGWIPFAGKVVKRPIATIEAKFIHYLADVEKDLAGRVVRYFSALAHTIVSLSEDVYETAMAISALAWYVEKKIGKAAVGGNPAATYAKAAKAEREARLALKLAHDAHGAITKPTQGAVKTAVTVATKPLTARVGRLERSTDARLDRLEHARTAAVPVAVPHTGTIAYPGRLEVERLWKTVRRHERLLGAGAFAGLFVGAMAKLKIGWLRCWNVRDAGRAVCRMDARRLASLLDDSLMIVGTISIVELARELGGATELVSDAVHSFVRES